MICKGGVEGAVGAECGHEDLAVVVTGALAGDEDAPAPSDRDGRRSQRIQKARNRDARRATLAEGGVERSIRVEPRYNDERSPKYVEPVARCEDLTIALN